jgi:hypothetical protein
MKNVGGWHSFYELSFLYNPFSACLSLLCTQQSLKETWPKLAVATVAIVAVATKSLKRCSHTQ